MLNKYKAIRRRICDIAWNVHRSDLAHRLNVQNFSQCYRSTATQRTLCLPSGVYRMEKYAHGNFSNGRGRIRARALHRKSYSMRTSMPVECTPFKALYTFHPRHCIPPQQHSPGIILRVHSPQIRTTVVCRSTDEYICTRMLPFNPYFILWLSNDPCSFFCSCDKRVFALWRTAFLLKLHSASAIYCMLQQTDHPLSRIE